MGACSAKWPTNVETFVNGSPHTMHSHTRRRSFRPCTVIECIRRLPSKSNRAGHRSHRLMPSCASCSRCDSRLCASNASRSSNVRQQWLHDTDVPCVGPLRVLPVVDRRRAWPGCGRRSAFARCRCSGTGSSTTCTVCGWPALPSCGRRSRACTVTACAGCAPTKMTENKGHTPPSSRCTWPRRICAHSRGLSVCICAVKMGSAPVQCWLLLFRRSSMLLIGRTRRLNQRLSRLHQQLANPFSVGLLCPNEVGRWSSLAHHRHRWCAVAASPEWIGVASVASFGSIASGAG